jgi:prolyl oligopeptidase
MRAAHFLLCVTCLAPVSVLAHTFPLRVQTLSAKVSLPPSPPRAPVRPVTDTYYGTALLDPFRYMENLDDPEVQSWIKVQNDYTRAVIASLPGRQKLLSRIVELNDSAAADIGSLRRLPGDVYLYTKLLATEDTYKLYLRKGITGQEKLLLDPQRIDVVSHGKGKNAIGSFTPSDDLKYVAVTIIPGGSEDNTEIHIIEIASGRETGDVITHCCVKSYPAWLPDNRAFVYGRLQTLPPSAPTTEVRQKYRTYLHVLGIDPAKDQPVFGYGVVPSIEVDPRLYASIWTQPDSKYALGVIGLPIAAPNSAFYIAPVDSIGKSTTPWREVADLSDDVADIAIHGDDLYLLTFKNTPRYKIIHLDARKPDLSTAETILPPTDAVIEDMFAAQDALYVRLLDGGIGRVLRVPYGPGARPEKIPLPFEGAVFPFRPAPPQGAAFGSDPRIPGALLLLNSWTKAYKIYAYDPTTRQVSDTKLQPAGPHDEFADVETLEVKVPSHDGTLVPLSIARPKKMKFDGLNPTLLYGYGAYGISQGPEFDHTLLAWYERGGIKATCHVRGGGEYGEEWHQAGKGPTKSNTWLDFIACAQYLIEKKYTSPAHLAGQGASMGGIMVGRAITDRPDLFAAVLVDAGVPDMLRAETTDLIDVPEVGNSKTEAGFKALYAMSPYYFVKDGSRYPAALFAAGMNDSRLKPWQSAKMVARLQAATTSGKPVLLYVDYTGGHDMGNTTREYEARLANSWSFLLWQFGEPEFQPVGTHDR